MAKYIIRKVAEVIAIETTLYVVEGISEEDALEKLENGEILEEYEPQYDTDQVINFEHIVVEV